MSSIFLELSEGLSIAWRAISANKIRAALTMLGIFIGITAVVLMSTAIKGIDNSLQEGVSALGSDVLYIDKYAWFSNQEWWRIRNRRNIDMEDFHRFKDLAKLPLAIAPVTNSVQTIKVGDRKVENIFLTGSNSDYVKTTNFDFASGRFYSEIEGNGSRNVAVIGSEINNKLFPRGDALDKTIKIGPVNFKVVGVLTEQGSTMLGAFNPDNQVFVPIGTIFKNFVSRHFNSVTINVRAASPEKLEDTKAEAEGIMRKIRGLSHNQPNDFTINQQEGLTSFLDQITIVIKIAGLFITGLSLFVGAIGIMNIMFVSVKERTKEIGLRKAIGATRRTILVQFLLESSVICLIGGLIGLLAAILLSLMLNQFFPTSIQYDVVIIAILISLLTGIVSGLAPAYTAAKMDPVDALRYE
ncbi:MAG: ABC transporter permease [Ignavibacteriaceae bacterium]|nr:ABC transporter permease [Ignavibacterium sp.]MCC6253356.1 ABC transporter permease [Ignavibacteriaceae bacterium]HRN27312.1 ABC transporter permease [Ignavibacteriaceae bacterium]HRP92285.1 ABC transporter permease [Ignavibacteriaceae bacterium]HRQ53754.1 ABC transporter permease [Ignavibacteriaceae bacterium]